MVVEAILDEGGVVDAVVVAVVVVVGCIVVVVGCIVVVVGCIVVVVSCIVVVVGCAVVAVVTSTVVVAVLDAAGPTVAGPDERTMVPATTGRTVVLGLEVPAPGDRRVVLALALPATGGCVVTRGLGVVATSDVEIVTSGEGGVTESSVTKKNGSAMVDDVVVVDAASNCSDADLPDPAQPPTAVTVAAKSPIPTRRARNIRSTSARRS